MGEGWNVQAGEAGASVKREERRGGVSAFLQSATSPLNVTRRLGEQVVLAVDLGHAVPENHLPLVLDPVDLKGRPTNRPKDGSASCLGFSINAE